MKVETVTILIAIFFPTQGEKRMLLVGAQESGSKKKEEICTATGKGGVIKIPAAGWCNQGSPWDDFFELTLEQDLLL